MTLYQIIKIVLLIVARVIYTPMNTGEYWLYIYINYTTPSRYLATVITTPLASVNHNECSTKCWHRYHNSATHHTNPVIRKSKHPFWNIILSWKVKVYWGGGLGCPSQISWALAREVPCTWTNWHFGITSAFSATQYVNNIFVDQKINVIEWTWLYRWYSSVNIRHFVKCTMPIISAEISFRM